MDVIGLQMVYLEKARGLKENVSGGYQAIKLEGCQQCEYIFIYPEVFWFYFSKKVMMVKIYSFIIILVPVLNTTLSTQSQE